jgi:hypothetical protein
VLKWHAIQFTPDIMILPVNGQLSTGGLRAECNWRYACLQAHSNSPSIILTCEPSHAFSFCAWPLAVSARLYEQAVQMPLESACILSLRHPTLLVR